MCTVSPNKPMQRAGTHKVLGRGRPMFSHSQVCLARVLNCRRAVADGCRSATLPYWQREGALKSQGQ
jgi:hypothetical protein